MSKIRNPVGRGLDANFRIYTKMDVWTGTRVMAGSRKIEELYKDQIENWSIDDLVDYLRGKYGNADLHVRAYGRPGVRSDWYQVPKLLKFENVKASGDLILTLRRENGDLRSENQQLKDRLSAIEAKLSDMGKEDPDPGEPSDIGDMIGEFIGDLLPMLKPIAMQGIANHIQSKIAQPNPVPHIVHSDSLGDGSTIDHPTDPASQAIDDGEYDVPDEVLEFLDTVDWTKADIPKLISAVKMFGLLPFKQS